MAAPVGQRLSRRLTAGSAAALDFELVAEGELVTDLEGAVATAMIRRIVTPPDAARRRRIADGGGRLGCRRSIRDAHTLGGSDPGAFTAGG